MAIKRKDSKEDLTEKKLGKMKPFLRPRDKKLLKPKN